MFNYFRNNHSLSKDSKRDMFPHTHYHEKYMSLTHCHMHEHFFVARWTT